MQRRFKASTTLKTAEMPKSDVAKINWLKDNQRGDFRPEEVMSQSQFDKQMLLLRPTPEELKACLTLI